MLQLAAIIPKPALDVLEDVLKFWHDVFGGGANSWGFAIIMLTFTIRLLILPLTFKSVKSMQKLQVLQPEMKKIQERYKEDKQRQQQEMMAFYKENQVNPLGSCLPLLLQLPFFVALFELLRSESFKADIAGNESFLFLPDLAKDLQDKPVVLVFMIVLYIATQIIASLITMAGGDKNQRRIMLALPFLFVIPVTQFQAGLILYWVTTNFWTIGQQLVVRKLYPKPDLDAAHKAAEDKHGAAIASAAASKDAKASTGTNGNAGKPPPPSPRKKKRSGRQR